MAYRDVILADGPSNYWRLNEPSGLVATDLVGGKNGTISGGVTLNQPGALADGDTAMTFNGTTGKIVTAAACPLVPPFTFEAWMKTTLSGCLFGVTPGTGQQSSIIFVNAATFVSMYVDRDGTGATTSQPRALINLNDNFWHHIVWRMTTSTTVELYVDGVLKPLDFPLTVTVTPGNSAGVGQIGWNPTFLQWWSGSLDDVAIYPSALTPAQIANHYASAFALSVPSGGADDDDEDDDDEARFRLQEFYGSIAGSVHVAASDSGLIPLVPARSKHTLFVQRLAPVVTTGGPANWTVQDGAQPPVPLLIAPASAVAVLPVRDFGANGVPCTEGAPLLLNLSAAGAAGWLTWEGYRKLTGVETLPSSTPPHYRDLVIADGASNYWRLNDPSGTTATEIIGGVHGTISGGVTVNQPGALSDGDKAMTFNGSTGQIVTSSVALASDFTMEAWIKTTALGSIRTIISNYAGAVAGPGKLYLDTTGILAVFMHPAGSVNGVRVVTDGQWHHAVWTQTSSTATIWIDGIIDITAGKARATGAGTPASIGYESNPVAAQWWSGSLDDVAIYPLALTAAQIAAHYAARANL